MTEYEIEFQSTPTERYDTDMNEKIRKAIEADEHIEYLYDEGGSGFDVADNIFGIRADIHTVNLVERVQEIFAGRDWRLREVRD